jgi:hypothetical protein
VTAPASAPTAGPAHHPALRVAGALGGDLFFYALVWVGIGAALLTANLVANGVWGDVESSVWEGNSIVVQYVLVAAGIMVSVSYLPVYVTHGITRRHFSAGALVAVVGLAVGAALATTLAFVVEHLVFSAADWPHVIDADRDMHIYDRPDQYGLIFVELGALYVAHVIAGLVIGAALFRLGWWYGSVFLVAGAAIGVGAEMALAGGFAGVALNEWLDIEPPPVGVGLALAAGLAALGALGARALLAGMPIESGNATWWR